MKTSWYIKNISNQRVQLLHLTYDDESKDLEIKDAETNSKIVIFVENLSDFKNQFDKIYKLIEKIDPRKNKTKNYGAKFSEHLKKIRIKFPNAYKPWSKENDIRLNKMFLDGKSQSEIAKFFQRGPGSIKSRLKKLGLIEDDDESELISE
jgi:hypothetical protein